MADEVSRAGSSGDSDLQPALAESPRLMSLDALRGFDMFWIIGGAHFAQHLSTSVSDRFGAMVVAQTTHPEWNGYTPWDQIFPLFMFIAGVAMPFSLTKRVEQGHGKWQLVGHVIRRGLMLVLLGMIYNGLLNFDFENQRYPSVLGRIGLSYLFAGLIVLYFGIRGQILWTVGILAGYWALMKFVPVPGFGAGDLTSGHTWEGYIDRLVLPGRLYETVRDPEGIVSTIPSIATVLSGALAGFWLRSTGPSGVKKAAYLLIAGGICAVLARAWHPAFPINKNLWTSSFVLYTTGWSLILLSLFYMVIDVWGYRRWAFFFVVIGMNAITIYLLREFIDFPAIAQLLLGRNEALIHPALFAGAEVLLAWLLLYFLYRNRIFLKV